MATRIAPATGGSMAMSGTSRSPYTMALTGMHTSATTPTPIRPAVRPSMMVSALNTREMSPLLAPMARRMPISFLRSSTET